MAYIDLGQVVGATGAKGDTGETGATGAQGPAGQSAYELAVASGFEGTEAEWLASLKGEKGDTGETGPAGADGKTMRTARFVVGTSTAGWTEADCDYLCDGTEDNEEIEAALDALPDTGGEVILLNGEYNIVNPVVLNKANVTLYGNGSATKLYQCEEEMCAIKISADCCTVRNLRIYGSQYNSGIEIVTGNYCMIQGNFIYLTADTASEEKKAAIVVGANVCGISVVGNTIEQAYAVFDLQGWRLVISGNFAEAAVFGTAACISSVITGNCFLCAAPTLTNESNAVVGNVFRVSTPTSEYDTNVIANNAVD